MAPDGAMRTDMSLNESSRTVLARYPDLPRGLRDLVEVAEPWR